MALTGMPPGTDADIARVTEALAMITPRWNARILLALAGRPLRYSEVAAKMPWLQPGQLHPKLRHLCESGLVERTEYSGRHVTYEHTARGTALLPVLPLISTWAEAHLEESERPLPAIEQIEDGLTLLTRRHAAAILWVLKARQETSGRALAQTILPTGEWTNIYPPLRQLVTDGLVDNPGTGQPYRLSAAGQGLAPVLAALSAWAAGRPLAQAAQHPLWGRPQKPAASQWVSNPPRPIPAAAPDRTAAGYSRDLFSHPAARRVQPALPAGGPRR
ncbi:winged helix-turn-helix transcriptional regulator [Streptomyces sp. NPDC004111]|uniref:winged helix-turn-helix transcriptional regulator n=1 Tax=Streptomyces sp. NPDC004111 TaxID=3364690 RepID=UPI003673DACF